MVGQGGTRANRNRSQATRHGSESLMVGQGGTRANRNRSGNNLNKDEHKDKDEEED
jgi:hypothetical protein